MQEELLIQGEAKKTTIKYFTDFSGQTSDDKSIFYVIADLNDNPYKLVQSSIDTKFGLDALNYNIPLSALTSGYKIYTGSVITEERNLIFTDSQKSRIVTNYKNSIIKQSQNNNISVNNNLPSIFSAVFFEESPFTDYYLNLKVNRSIESLDTLNIYNIPINEVPKFNNDKGVLFGKIEAIQVITDDSGEKFRIPLKDAVVGIFNPSEEIPSVGNVDQNGNRIRLNLFENLPYGDSFASIQSYGSFQSYLTDVNFSPTDLENRNIPAKYKYTSITNENGEFIIHNIPTGQQTLMIEVDLLKQGLEPEEVALNFFPYPTIDDPNVSNIPHLYFNQFPVNIVPSWGDFQTGYTQINLSIVLDLRKWVTYYTYPVSAKVGNSQNISNTGGSSATPKVLEELYLEGVNNPLTVNIRDMTRPFVVDNPPKVELVKIIDIYDRNLDLQTSWNNEFKLKNNKVEFDTSNYNAFKLPANLYDPEGINTQGRQGVWLCAYQFKIEYPGNDVSYQATGFAEEWPTNPNGASFYVKANHYDLNRYEDWTTEAFQAIKSPMPGSGIGIFPYQRPWSTTYPEPYKITKKPVKKNPLKSWDAQGNPILNVNVINNAGVTNNISLTEKDFNYTPRFLDGDMAGGSVSPELYANGYGQQRFSFSLGPNLFSREVTTNEIWRYETNDHWGEQWSNGYQEGITPSDYNKYPDTPRNYGKPNIDGERYQRLEAGYAYWLRPRGWPRIKNDSFGDYLLPNDHVPDADHNQNVVFDTPSSYSSYFDGIYNYIDEVTLQVGIRAPWFTKFGRLNIYRVEKPYYVLPKKPPFVDKYAVFNFGTIIVDQSADGDVCKDCIRDSAGRFIWLEQGGRNDEPDDKKFIKKCETQFTPVVNFGLADIQLKNIGTTKVTINGTEVSPTFNWSEQRLNLKINSGDKLRLPANDLYDPINNTYNGASYLINLGTKGGTRSGTLWGGLTQPIYRYNVGIEGLENSYFISSLIPRQVGLGTNKCAAVRDYNSPSQGFFGNVFNLFVDTFLITVGLGLPLLIPKARDNFFASVRNVLTNSEDLNADARAGKNKGYITGVFLGGFGYYQNIFPMARPFFDGTGGQFSVSARGFLPYLGNETALSRTIDLRTSVPYCGSNWFNDFKNHLNNGSSISVFQPKPLINNNLKGTRNTPYFMEFFENGANANYGSTGFDI